MVDFHVCRSVKVLLVDDDPLGRQVVSMMLTHAGIDVVEAVNGAEAVALVRNEDFDLVLMDSQMPVMDGVAATLAIRSLDKAGVDILPILAMTADVFDTHKIKYKNAGMNGIIEKPVEIDKLYGQISHFLSLPPQHEEGAKTASQAVASADLQAALPGIDVEAGLHLVLDNCQAYLALLRKFVAHYSTTEQLLRADLESGKQKEAIRRVHTIKGLAGGLGATALQQVAAQLERQLSRGEIPSAMDDMLLELNQLLTAIENLPAEKVVEDDNVDNLSGSAENLAAQLRSLIEPLHNLQVQVINARIIPLKQTTWPEEYRSDLHQLQLLIEEYQYAPAVELLESLLARLP